jgi:hypothetical protein
MDIIKTVMAIVNKINIENPEKIILVNFMTEFGIQNYKINL